jgi:peptide/nickel transport system substrate-binding protein
MWRFCTMVLVVGAVACAEQPERGNTILFASGADLQSMNPLVTVHPLAKQVQRYALLTTLVRYDADLSLQPYLASSWHWSDDRHALTFTLHPHLMWDDGTPTTATDVAWTLNAARDPRASYPRSSDLVSITQVEIGSDTTVTITFDHPMPAVPDVFTDLAILPAHHFRELPLETLRQAPWNQRPIGNGPFRFIAHEPNRRWVFQAKPDFPEALGGPPAMDRFIVVVVDEPTTKLAALTAGELDFAGISPAHAEFVRRDTRLEVADYPLLFTYGMVFNARRPPFDDPSIRHAVSLALDRRQIVDGYLFGFGKPTWEAVPEGVPGRLPPAPGVHDPDSARALLAGRSVSLELLTVGSGEAPLEQMIQAQLTAVGFRVSIRQLELGAFLDRVYGSTREFDVAVMGIPGDLALGFLRPLIELTGVEAPSSPAEVQEVLRDSASVVFLYHARGVSGRNRRVRHVVMDLRGELPSLSRWDASPMNSGSNRE